MDANPKTLELDKDAPCEGRCGAFGSCYGEILPCHVYTPSKHRKWGTYSYCENARRQTVKAGYVVEVAKARRNANTKP